MPDSLRAAIDLDVFSAIADGAGTTVPDAAGGGRGVSGQRAWRR